MSIPVRSSFRARIFLVLTLVSIIPAVLTLVVGTMVLREVVVSTGSAGAWDEVAGSGRDLFAAIGNGDSPSSELVAATERHRAALAESVRFSRLYAFLGERILFLLPVFAVLLLILVAGIALVAANWFSRDFSRPVEELVEWTKSLALGDRLPSAKETDERREVSEFAHLRDALRVTSAELGEAREREVEQARIRSWSEMSRKIAHELKNPLTPMAMAAERVSRSEEASISEAGEVLREEIRRLEELARTFSQFGRPPEGPMSSVDLTEMLSSLAHRLSADGMAIRFDAQDGPIFVQGHLDALERVVRNLLSNAQDSVQAQTHAHSQNGVGGEEMDADPIRIEVAPSEGWVEVGVLDRGTGIPDDALPHIWEPEFTMKRKGTGLGLAMVRQVARAHGGEVEARNREGGGAEFRLRLPLRQQDPQSRAARLSSQVSGTPDDESEPEDHRSDTRVGAS